MAQSTQRHDKLNRAFLTDRLKLWERRIAGHGISRKSCSAAKHLDTLSQKHVEMGGAR